MTGGEVRREVLKEIDNRARQIATQIAGIDQRATVGSLTRAKLTGYFQGCNKMLAVLRISVMLIPAD